MEKLEGKVIFTIDDGPIIDDLQISLDYLDYDATISFANKDIYFLTP